jgi:hypothetical protein
MEYETYRKDSNDIQKTQTNETPNHYGALGKSLRFSGAQQKLYSSQGTRRTRISEKGYRMKTELKMPEYEAGNITYDMGLSTITRPVNFIGVLFQLTENQTVRYAIEDYIANNVPPPIALNPYLTIKMQPCGEVITYPTLDDVPETDVPCTCGNPNHWFIKIERK